MRSFLAAAVCDNAVAAGIMASSSGSARLTPAPLSSVRRDRCFFVKNIFETPYFCSLACMRKASLVTTPATMADSRIIVFRRAADNRSYLRHIEILELASQRIHHQLFRQRLCELVGAGRGLWNNSCRN